MTEENKNNEKSIYVITDNTDEERLTLVKLTKGQVDAIDWFLDEFDIDMDIEAVREYTCEEP